MGSASSHVALALRFLIGMTFSSNRHPILAFCLRMIFFGKPVSTPDQVRGRLFPDHALHDYGTGRIEEKRTIA
jgi:hypothetical protein